MFKRIVGGCLLLCGLLLSGALTAEQTRKLEQLPKIELENQFGEKITVTEDASFIIFAADRKASDLLREAFEGVQQPYLDEHRIYLLADISAMPSVITKMFALPKLRTRPYSLLLDYEGELSKVLPHQEARVTVISLDKGVVQTPAFAESIGQLKVLLPTMPEPPTE